MNHDSLDMLQSLLDLPLLTAEQEVILFQQIDKGGKLAEEARETLFVRNSRLVISIARTVRPNFDLADKIGYGFIGLRKAIDKFKWEKGYRFSTYATSAIRQSIKRGVNDASEVCGFRLPTHLIDEYFKIQFYIERDGVEPTLELLMNHPGLTGMNEKKANIILRFLKDKGRALSIDVHVTSKNGRSSQTVCDFIVDQAAAAPFEGDGLSEDIESLLVCLTTRQRQAVALYFLGEKTSLTQVAKTMGVSQKRAHELIVQSLKKMRYVAQQKKMIFPVLPR